MAAKQAVHKLAVPVQFGSDLVEQVTITRKLAFLRGQRVQAGVNEAGDVTVTLDIGANMDLAAKMIGQVPAFLDELDEKDLGVIMEAASDFLFSALGTGNKRSA